MHDNIVILNNIIMKQNIYALLICSFIQAFLGKHLTMKIIYIGVMAVKKVAVPIILVLLALVLAACGGGKLKDGSYEGRSTADSRGAYGVVKIEVKDGKIASAEFLQYNSDGTVKDESYGKESGEENYKKAQDALENSRQYPEKLVETQNVDKVDAVTGATSSWKQFQEAAKDALAKAKED
jgi:major membrane immunogen (membrane-anchored lipoprotein)